MKLHCIKELAAALLLLCSWATVSAVELNVQPNHTDKNNLRGTNRQLSNDVFKKYENTECLKQNRKEGGQGRNYDEIADLKNRQECENECRDNKECTGFEYSKIGSFKVCMLWKTPIGIEPDQIGSSRKSDCYIKEDNTMTEQVGTQVEKPCQKKCLNSCKNNPSDKNDNFKVYKKTECLKQNRKEGGQRRNYYERNDVGSRRECRKECRTFEECTGFEYSKIDSAKVCKLWKTPIGIEPDQIGSSKKSDCYIKDDNAMTEQSGTQGGTPCDERCLENCKRNNMFT